MTLHFRATALIAALVLMIGCAAMQALKPQNVGEGILLASAMVTQGYQTTAALHESGALSQADASRTLDRLDAAANKVDAANEALMAYRAAPDPEALSRAERHVAEALNITRAVQVYLQERER